MQIKKIEKSGNFTVSIFYLFLLKNNIQNLKKLSIYKHMYFNNQKLDSGFLDIKARTYK